MKLWLDDKREAPLGWMHVKTYADAMAILRGDNVVVDEISLDHDLGTKETGYDVAVEIEKMHNLGKSVPKVSSHSVNPVGRSKINAVAKRVATPKKESNMWKGDRW